MSNVLAYDAMAKKFYNTCPQMMSKQQKFGMTEDSLKDAFRYFDNKSDLRATLGFTIKLFHLSKTHL
jgi:hypothetical protein